MEQSRASIITGLAPLVWLTLGLAIYSTCMALTDALLMPFEKLSVLVLQVYRVLADDLLRFMILL